jgi:hypothetical protein
MRNNVLLVTMETSRVAKQRTHVPNITHVGDSHIVKGKAVPVLN